MRRRSEVEHERRLIGEAIGLSDADVLVELQLAGYKADTIVVARTGTTPSNRLGGRQCVGRRTHRDCSDRGA